MPPSPSSTLLVHGPERAGSPPRKRPRLRLTREEEEEQHQQQPSKVAAIINNTTTARNGVAPANDDHATTDENHQEDGISENSGDIVSKEPAANGVDAQGAFPWGGDQIREASNEILPASNNSEDEVTIVVNEANVVSLLSDDDDDDSVIEVIDVEQPEFEAELQAAGPSSVTPNGAVVDLTHQPQRGYYYAIVRGLVNGRAWSGVTNCMECAYSSVRYAPAGASSYVITTKRVDTAMTIVREECDPARIRVHQERSVDPELLDVVMYTDGCCMDERSSVVKNVWAKLRPGSPKYFTGYGVWFSEDCVYNSCGLVPGKQTAARAEIYALCKGLETVVEHMQWAGRVLVRSDADLQDAREMSAQLAAEPKKYAKSENFDLWKRIDVSMLALEARDTIVIFEWVKAHAMSYGNMRADKLARAGGIANISAAEPFQVEANIRWSRYHPKGYNVPAKYQKITNMYAVMKRPVRWSNRSHFIQCWAQRKAGLTAEPCLDKHPTPDTAYRQWSELVS